MTISSADPDCLRAFADEAEPLRNTLGAQAETVAGVFASFAAANLQAGSTLGAIPALGSLLQEMATNEAFVTTIVSALVSADAWGSPTLRTLDDAGLAKAIAGQGGLADSGYLTVGPDSLLGVAPTSGFVDDPVCTATGNFFHVECDLAFPARAGLLNLERCYNSMGSARSGAFGPGWASLLDMAVLNRDTSVSVRLSDGAEIAFVPSDTAGSHGRRTWVGEGRHRLRLHGSAEKGWTLADGPASGFSFDESGRLIARWSGRARVRFRRTEGLIASITEEASGRSIELAWEGGRVATATSSDGRRASYRYDEGGHLTGVSRPSGAVSYGITAARVTSVTDADGVVIVTNTYDDEGRVTRQESPFGRTSVYTYGEAGFTVVTDTDGAARNAFVHDRRGNLRAMVGADGAALRLSYDDGGCLTGWRDRRGAEWAVAWNPEGTRPIRRAGPLGMEEIFAWDDQERLLSHHSPRGTTTWTYEGRSRVPRQVVEPGGRVTTVEVGDDELPLRVTDPDGVQVDLIWDQDGRLVSAIDALGGATRLAYDPAGHLGAWTSPGGRSVRFSLDEAGRVLSATGGRSRWSYQWSGAGRGIGGTDPLEGPWKAAFGPHGAVSEVVGQPDGPARAITFDYDAFGNAITITGPDGRIYHQAFDGLSQLVAVTDPGGSTWRHEHDPEGALIAVIEPTGATSRRQLDALGRTVAEVDAAGRTWERTWGSDGRLAAVTDPAGRPTAYTYDPAGNLIEVTHEGTVVATWSYTRAGRLARRWSIGGDAISVEYDEAGRVSAVSDSNGRLRIVSDLDGRIVRAIDDKGQTLSVERDQDGHVSAVIDRRGNRRILEVDDAGRPVASGTAAGASRFGWEGPLLRQAADPLGATSTYGYDEAGRLASVTDPAGGVTTRHYDPAGRLGAVTDPTGLTTSLIRDAAGSVTGVSYTDGSGIRRFLDPAGLATGYGPLTADRPVVPIERDPAGIPVGLPPVSALHRPPALPPPVGLGFDTSGRVSASPAGDLFRHDADGQLFEWVPGPSLAARVDAVRFCYDAGGRLVAETAGADETTYTHDAAGRLIRRVGPDGSITTFTYDAAGRRVAQDGPGNTSVRYEWDAAGRLARIVRTTDGVESGQTIAYDNLGLPEQVGDVRIGWELSTGWPAVSRIGATTYEWTDEGLYARTDGGASAPVLLDWARNAEDGLDPWGAGPGTGVRLGYRAELCIDSLVYLRARVYDPATRSFLSPDPLPNPAGAPCAANPYHYAWNDPVSLVDPSGLRPLTQAEFDKQRHLEEIGRFGQAWEAINKDPWGTAAMGLVIVVGVGLCFATGGLAVVGVGILMGAGTSAAVGIATGTFSPTGVAVNGAIGGIMAGLGPLGLADGGLPSTFGDPAEDGIALFRGTSEGFAGSPGTQLSGFTPASSDPGVATAFAIHADQFGSGVVQIASPADLAGVKTAGGILSYESEVAANLTPQDFSLRAGTTITSDQARSIMNALGVQMPTTLSSPEDLTTFLKSGYEGLSQSQIQQFIRLASG